MTSGNSRRPAAEQLAATVERLAALLGAGVAPRAAWFYLAELADVGELDGDDAVQRIAGRIGDGDDIADAIASAHTAPRRRLPEPRLPDSRLPGGRPLGDRAFAGRALGGRPRAGGAVERERAGDRWRVLAASWSVAEEAGAPLGRCLADIAASLTALGTVERDVAAALAGPRATTRLVTALPVVSLLLGWLLGLDSIRVLFGTPAGGACLATGIALLAAAQWWSARLLRKARSGDLAPGLALDLLAVALTGGVSIDHARAAVARALQRYLPEASPTTDHRIGDERAADGILRLAARAGAAPAELLRSEAARLRRDAVSRATERAASLGVWLMLPLGLCVLPSFLLLAVAPVLIGIITDTVAL